MESKERPLLQPTPLREFHAALVSMSEGEQLALAEHHLERPDRLASRFAESVKIVAAYRPIDEPFHDPRSALERCLDAREIRDTADFSSMLVDGEVQEVGSDRGLAFRYVDREVFPLRTTTKDGPRPKPRKIDLLLASEQGRPIVGELKIRHDSLAPVALVQALMYAAELSSPSQLHRLADHYLDETRQPIFRIERDEPPLDIYLISFKPEGTNSKPGLSIATRLGDLLMNDDRIGSYIGRIAVVRASADHNGALSFAEESSDSSA